MGDINQISDHPAETWYIAMPSFQRAMEQCAPVHGPLVWWAVVAALAGSVLELERDLQAEGEGATQGLLQMATKPAETCEHDACA